MLAVGVMQNNCGDLIWIMRLVELSMNRSYWTRLQKELQRKFSTLAKSLDWCMFVMNLSGSIFSRIKSPTQLLAATSAFYLGNSSRIVEHLRKLSRDWPHQSALFAVSIGMLPSGRLKPKDAFLCRTTVSWHVLYPDDCRGQMGQSFFVWSFGYPANAEGNPLSLDRNAHQICYFWLTFGYPAGKPP